MFRNWLKFDFVLLSNEKFRYTYNLTIDLNNINLDDDNFDNDTVAHVDL